MNTTARLLRTLPVLAAATTVFVLPVTTSSASAAPHTVSSAISDKSKPKPALVDTGKCTQGGSDETHANAGGRKVTTILTCTKAGAAPAVTTVVERPTPPTRPTPPIPPTGPIKGQWDR
ncbi:MULTISPECIES: hypothetical protein [unclassified Streptomyces]|uniref:hypothetical protein n=1 Tax=unclassified Streptomyces TaxID=2593676 RepID=UPI002E377BAC|nr:MULTISPECIES: hypothetical protein [unclassified Streptomyces]WUC68942.1 hypothetical protein OG861_32255 [Streptomyces sp. NBC_00539]